MPTYSKWRGYMGKELPWKHNKQQIVKVSLNNMRQLRKSAMGLVTSYRSAMALITSLLIFESILARRTLPPAQTANKHYKCPLIYGMSFVTFLQL